MDALPEPRDRPGESGAADSSREPEAGAGGLRFRLERLPFGHPSSPYDDHGRSRADRGLTSLRELELPSPEEPDAGEQGPDASTQDETTTAEAAWDKALPGLTAQWERHLERWPEAAKAPADRSGDEPGSWRGDGGQYLNAEENLVAGHALEQVRDAEPEVTRTLRSVESAVPGARLVGLEFRLKGEERYKEKIAAELRAKPDRPIPEITVRLPDSIRYTFSVRAENYFMAYSKLCESLTHDGNEILMIRNSWHETDYNGVNTRWLTQGGQTFEVQFHTPESFRAKQVTHDAYERLRSGNGSGAELPELEVFQQTVSSYLAEPPGVSDLTDYRKKGY
jgi:hypothetical protein